MDEGNNLKVFFIKLISITIAIIIIINVFFNLVISNVGFIEKLVSLSEVENRKEYADKLRNDLNELLEKENIIREEDKILIYKFYKKLESEFKEIE